MTKECEICKLILERKKENTYFETEKIVIFKFGDIVYGCPKEHTPIINSNEASGLIKLMMKVLGKYHPNQDYSLKTHNKEHIYIFTKV